MANISLITAGRVEIVQSLMQLTLPAAEAIVAGAPVRLDGSTGKFTNANGTSVAEASAFGIAMRSVAAGEPVTAIRKGYMDGYDLSGLSYGDPVYISDTDGRLADAAGTVSKVIGRVIPATAVTLGTALDKILMVDFEFNNEVADNETVTFQLTPAQADAWAFVANRAYTVLSIKEVHSVAGAASSTLKVRKVTDASAPGAAAGATVIELLASAFALDSTVNTIVSGSLSVTPADLELAAGDKIGLDINGTVTSLSGTVTIELQPA